MSIVRKPVIGIEDMVKSEAKEYVRYKEDAELFSVGERIFMTLAKDYLRHTFCTRQCDKVIQSIMGYADI